MSFVERSPSSLVASEVAPHAPKRSLLPDSMVPMTSPGGTQHPVTDPESGGMTRMVSEFDIAAYAKDEFTTEMERNVMKRCFDAFDVLQHGALGQDEVRKLSEFIGGPKGLESTPAWQELFSHERVGFDAFWAWWQVYSKSSSRRMAASQFAMVASLFSHPFHEQQLITEETGEKFTATYRVWFKFRDRETGEVTPISPWHDIPFVVRSIVRTHAADQPSNSFNFICEIPKWTRAKFEINTTEPFNPIRQDLKNGVPRFYKHGDMMWNYGAFPQTWESTEVRFMDDIIGDNDPLDAIEIGMTQFKTGWVTTVKVLGILGMIDDGQMDWKVICISREDPIAPFLDDIHDVPKFLPGCLDAIREFLRVYKICQGGQENKFAFDGEFKDKEYAMRVMREAHLMWSNLFKVRGQTQAPALPA